MTIISFSQSWEYKEDGNAFDGNYKFAAVEGKGSDCPYNNPILFIRKFDNGEPVSVNYTIPINFMLN